MKPLLIIRIQDKDGIYKKVNIGTRGDVQFKEKATKNTAERTIIVPAITEEQIKYLINNKLPSHHLFELNTGYKKKEIKEIKEDK